MEMKAKTHYRGKSLMICLYLLCLLTACNSPERIEVIASDIHPSWHSLLPLTPSFQIEVSGDTLYHRYLRFPKGKEFPLLGIIYVDGKGYRFMGGDSLRIQALVPLAGDSCGWKGKYSFLYPEKDWKESEYDDSNWQEGNAAFGSEGLWYVTNTFWDVENIFVRRHVTLNKESLNDRKLYVRFVCDDVATIYCNGDEVVHFDYTNRTIGCKQLPDTISEKLKDGDNLLAAHCYDVANGALLDYGLYAENREYDSISTAQLKSVDVQATQTRYTFQCDSVELKLSFVSPTLLQDQEFMGCPVGFLTYQVQPTDGRQHDVEVLFDMDMEWMFEKASLKESVEEDWKIITQGDSLYIGVKAEDVQSAYKDGRIILMQKNMTRDGTDSGVLLLGFKEREALQYYGENIPYYWERNKKTNIKEILKEVGNQYQSLQRKSDETDLYYSRKLSLQDSKIKAEKMLPYYRNFLATRRLSVAPDGELLCYSRIVGRVRDAFDSFPYLIFYERTDWMKASLKPVFDFCENGRWVKQFPPFDVGFFPIAIHQESVNDYGIEMAADMLMMSLAIVKAEKSFDYAEKHWNALSQWGDYLVNSVSEERKKAEELEDAKKKALEESKERELKGGKEAPLTKPKPENLKKAHEEGVKSYLGVVAYQELMKLKNGYKK